MMMRTTSEHRCFGGVQGFYRHASEVIGAPMRFSVYRPPQAVQGQGPVPVLFFLAGLTCTEETFMMKGGAQRYAAEHGVILVAPDTSARNTGIAGAKDAWDFGEGAGFYLDATQAPWEQSFRMESYIVGELLPLVLKYSGARGGKVGVFGHSMGGHGALTLALRHPEVFHSVSAFAPITAPSQCPWGQKAFSAYLGGDRETWRAHDASQLMAARTTALLPRILIDQGLDDQYLQTQLMPEQFEAACEKAGQPLTLRRHEGYDHNYYFISSFMQDHLAFHAEQLQQR
jgi:S-formylglutathione hydrolase